MDYADRARALVGTLFRLQGRSGAGLDCIGVALAVYGLPADSVRRNYRLRGDHAGEAKEALTAHFCRIARPEPSRGDLMLMRVAADQIHVGIWTDHGFVHAHARLRRVVETPGMPEWPLLGLYRRRSH